MQEQSPVCNSLDLFACFSAMTAGYFAIVRGGRITHTPGLVDDAPANRLLE